LTLQLEDIKTISQYENLIFPLTDEEYDSLKSSIRTNGLYLPIIISDTGIILDGHHRHKACNELDITGKYKVKKFENILLEKKFVIESNLTRRQLNDYQKGELGIPLLAIQKELAKLRQGKRNDLTSGSNEPQVTNERTRDIVAKQLGLSSTTFERTRKIIESNDEGLKEKLRSGETTVSAAYNKIRNDIIQNNSKTPEIPTDEYNVCYVDPPWKFDNQNTGGSLISGASQKYPTLSTDDIITLMKKLQFHKNSILFMWSTNAMLIDALRVISELGFTYKGKVTWHKSKFLGLGYWYRNVTEDCIFAIKGDVKAFHSQLPNFFEASNTKHSEKPEYMREIIEDGIKSISKIKKIEMFGRKETPGWTVFGNQIGGKIA